VPGEEKLKQLEKEIASKKESIQVIFSVWKKERDLIDTMKDLRESIDGLKNQALGFEREGNFGEVARIRYGEIPAKEKELSQIDRELKKLHDTGK